MPSNPAPNLFGVFRSIRLDGGRFLLLDYNGTVRLGQARNFAVGFLFGEAQGAHQFALPVVAPRRHIGDDAIERLNGRRGEQARQPFGIFDDQRPKVRRVVGKARDGWRKKGLEPSEVSNRTREMVEEKGWLA